MISDTFGKIRISALTERLFRIEFDENGKFCDMKTQTVISRDFGAVKCEFTEAGNAVTACSGNVSITADKATGKVYSAKISDGRIITDFSEGNLGGTARTLDGAKGEVKLGCGVASESGAAVIDDSESLVINSDNMTETRQKALGQTKGGRDLYYFLYGFDYKDAVRDFCLLTGKNPLIPRYALGVWWSRYYPYVQDEYIALMDKFREKKIPLTVATIDMGWHWEYINKRFGRKAGYYKNYDGRTVKSKDLKVRPAGWTGYSWDKDRFPDYKKFLSDLHKRGLRVTLNLHPAQGVRYYEDQYRKFAEYMGIDPKKKEPVGFDLTDKKFVKGYFDILHHPYEDAGVDFWWIDWQQGTKTKVEGLDNLWLLNDMHYRDISRNGKRPLILSRFAGFGSQRYPLGFSGDTFSLWSALKFQPYFTLTAANIGFFWWSHDIGGHMMGKRDDELYIRWIQFGVFSPILRLHSTQNEYTGKEPWKFSSQTEKTASDFLRLRHRLIPYIYSMNRRSSEKCIPLIEPMYWEQPLEENAYDVKNEYYFGSEMIAAPITEKTDEITRLSSAEVYLPEGRWTDVFTGNIYSGGKKIRMYRDLNSFPVFAKEGAIIPLSVLPSDGAKNINDCSNPEELEILVYSGNGVFELYEDDGETDNYKNGVFAVTKFKVIFDEDKGLKFTVSPVEGDISVLPEKRKITVCFKDISVPGGKNKITFEQDYGSEKNIEIPGAERKENRPKSEMITEIISKAQMSNVMKKILFSDNIKDEKSALKNLRNASLKGAVEEILSMPGKFYGYERKD